jgi:hypothetical protein
MQIPIANKIRLLLPAILIAGQVMADGTEGIEPNNEICKGKVESLEQCRWIEGTVSIYNGTPSIRIRQHGSQHLYAVGPAEHEWMPADLRSKLTVDNAIEADIKICPIGGGQQRGLPVVCIDESHIKRIRAIGP